MSWGGGGGGGVVNGIHCCPRGVNYTHPVLSHTVVPRRMRTQHACTHMHMNTCTHTHTHMYGFNPTRQHRLTNADRPKQRRIFARSRKALILLSRYDCILKINRKTQDLII